jgi:hypothetical protein
VAIGTTTNNVLDAVGASRPLVVQSASSTTTQYGSTNAITISNSDLTTSNSSQLNFAALTGTANQYSSAVISCIYGARTSGQYSTGILTFGTSTAVNNAPSEKMRISAAGAVGINTTRATARLCIDAGVETTFTALAMKDTDASTGGAFVAFTNSSNDSCGSITHSGTTTIAYNTSSDYRMKEDVQPMTGALNKVALLNPVTYKWKEKFGGTDGQGFIAHELQAVIPDCVSGEKDATHQEEYEVTPAVKDQQGNITTPAVMGIRTAPAYQGIDTSFLVATLTAAIQELKVINDTQAATITALTARIVALESTT